MESNPPTLPGAVRGATWLVGQAPQRRRWVDLAHRRPVFRARWTALRSACGRPDHGANRALPANAKNRSNGSVWSDVALETALERAENGEAVFRGRVGGKTEAGFGALLRSIHQIQPEIELGKG